MPLTGKLIKDLKQRTIFHQRELLKTALKFVFTNSLNKSIHEENYIEYSKSLQYFAMQPIVSDSKNKIVRRCILNNRARGNIREFGVNRVVLRDMIMSGVVPGYKKSQW
jgi:ribosomal protein S14